jgi:hypothetical protein
MEPDEEFLALAAALQRVRLALPLSARSDARKLSASDLAGRIQAAVCNAAWAAVPRLRDHFVPAVTTPAIDGDKIVVSASVPLSLTIMMTQDYDVRIDEGKMSARVAAKDMTIIATASGDQLEVIGPEPESAQPAK